MTDPSNARPLDGKVALVTGAGRGIGAAVTRALVAAGARVAMVSRTESDLRDLADQLAAGERIAVLPGDVADATSVDEVFSAAEAQLGALDILVNNAGIPTRRPFEVADYPLEDYDRITGVNLRGAFLCARAALRRMRERRAGTIIRQGAAAYPMGGGY